MPWNPGTRAFFYFLFFLFWRELIFPLSLALMFFKKILSVFFSPSLSLSLSLSFSVQ